MTTFESPVVRSLTIVLARAAQKADFCRVENAQNLEKRFIRFGPEGGSLRCDILTQGGGQLKIAARELPDGLTARLEGSALVISASGLPSGSGIRSGFVALRRAATHNTHDQHDQQEEIVIVQSPDSELTARSVNPCWITPSHPNGVIEVSASDPWRARIYNSSANRIDSDFRFVGGSHPYTWDSERDGNRPLDIVATGTNPGSDPCCGVAVFSLKEHPRYRRALMLCQDPGH